jgi:predicted transcriptional regulator
MSVTSIRLNPAVEGPLEQLALKLDRSKRYLINQAIVPALNLHHVPGW